MSDIRAYAAPRIFDGNQWHDRAALVVEGTRVREIVPVSAVAAGIGIEDLGAGFIAPGFVDLQVNGGGGVMLNDEPDIDAIRAICEAHARFGTTSLLPTMITDTRENRSLAIAAGIKAARENVPGFIGLHLEGPHLSVARKGAHEPGLIVPMESRDIAELTAAARVLPVLMTTVAAESVTPAQVRELVAAGIKVSIGHCNESAEVVLTLVEAGATLITHLFNAMSQLNSREPGMVGAALNSGALHVGLIADGHHVHPVTMAVAIRAKRGPGRIFLISDAMSTVGTDATGIVLNGRKVKREGGKLTLEDGTLAGADLDMATAVRVTHERVGIELDEALRMATRYPAEAIGIEGPGQLRPGNEADFVWLDDAITPRRTWIAGVAG